MKIKTMCSQNYASLHEAFDKIHPHRIDTVECNQALFELFHLNTYKHALEYVMDTTELSDLCITKIANIIKSLVCSIADCEKKLEMIFLLKHS